MNAYEFGYAIGTNEKAAAATITDAHQAAYVPLVGGAISGALKPHPNRGTVSNVLNEGAAGLGGGLSGGLGGTVLGAGLGALGGIKGFGAGAALGGLLGSSVGTYRGATTHRENLPLNARALEIMKQQAPPVKAAFAPQPGKI